MWFHHPNFLDRLRLKYNPHYLYPDQNAIVSSPVSVGIIHKLNNLTNEAYWQQMESVLLLPGSHLKFHGHVHDFKDFYGDVKPYDSLFELIHPVFDSSTIQNFSIGDLMVVSPSDRSRLVPVLSV